MKQNIKNILTELFEEYFSEKVNNIEVLPPSGSYREYCRLSNSHRSIIGAYNSDVKENEAFFHFSEQFLKKNIRVPEIYVIDNSQTAYLQKDLGNTTLFDFLSSENKNTGFSEVTVDAYYKVLRELPKIQVLGGEQINYSLCYPRAAFDKQSMMWDLNYFKYYFLKLAKIPFDEQALEDDFEAFTKYLLSAENGFFMYRDFQSRNIMLNNGEVSFIDYQGGRKGALQYDLASLLYDSKANIPQQFREKFLEFYLEQLQNFHQVDTDEFKNYFQGFVLIRMMQAMGAYGFRGFYEKKSHFLKSIPYALKNLEYLLKTASITTKFPELLKVLKEVTHSEFLRSFNLPEKKLTVHINSFSYKKGIPVDKSGNGGGFVFDCRAIFNPGRFDEYKKLNGKDNPVIEFLETKSEINKFLKPVLKLINQSVKTYIERDFASLCVNFGCTGGQHRSVYSAEKLAEHLRNNYNINVVVSHKEEKNWNVKKSV